jgi:GAF domain-containing protein
MSNFTQYNAQNDDFAQEVWRERFLQRILIISAIVGLFALIPAVISTSVLILQSVYIGVYVLLVASILIRFPYIVKAGLFVSLPLILGVGSLTETGIRGDSLFFFLAFVTFSTLLIGPRTGIATIIITEIVIVVMGYLVLNKVVLLSDRLAFEGDLTDWISAATSHLLITLVIMNALRMLNEGFHQTQQRAESLTKVLRESQTQLENRVEERTQELSQKTKLINAASFVAHQAAAIQDLDRLLRHTVNLISEQFGFYHVGIFLTNQRGDYVNLQAASSEGGKRLLERGYRLGVGTEGIIGFVAAEKKNRISLDVGKDAIFFDNPELSGTRSELSLPLIVRNRVIGVLDMQSAEVSAFKYDEIDIFQTMADQIAVTIENTRLITESQLVISQLETISNENTRQNWRSELTVRKPKFHYSVSGVHSIEKSVPQKGENILDVPIVLRGQKIGTISLQRKTEFHKWTAQEETLAAKVADQTALALENIRLVERTRQRANREQAIANVTARVRETLDLDTVLRTTAREIQRALNLQEAEVRLLPHQTGQDDRKKPAKVDPSQASGN